MANTDVVCGVAAWHEIPLWLCRAIGQSVMKLQIYIYIYCTHARMQPECIMHNRLRMYDGSRGFLTFPLSPAVVTSIARAIAFNDVAVARHRRGERNINCTMKAQYFLSLSNKHSTDTHTRGRSHARRPNARAISKKKKQQKKNGKSCKNWSHAKLHLNANLSNIYFNERKYMHTQEKQSIERERENKKKKL